MGCHLQALAAERNQIYPRRSGALFRPRPHGTEVLHAHVSVATIPREAWSAMQNIRDSSTRHDVCGSTEVLIFIKLQGLVFSPRFQVSLVSPRTWFLSDAKGCLCYRMPSSSMKGTSGRCESPCLSVRHVPGATLSTRDSQ